MKIDSGDLPKTAKCRQFSPGNRGSDMCICGHTLYEHYMCGAPQESRCLVCRETPTPASEPAAEPPRNELLGTLCETTEVLGELVARVIVAYPEWDLNPNLKEWVRASVRRMNESQKLIAQIGEQRRA